MNVSVKKVLRNGDVLISGRGLFRVIAGEEILSDLLTEGEALAYCDGYNGCRPDVEAQVVAYDQLALSSSPA